MLLMMMALWQVRCCIDYMHMTPPASPASADLLVATVGDQQLRPRASGWLMTFTIITDPRQAYLSRKS